MAREQSDVGGAEVPEEEGAQGERFLQHGPRRQLDASGPLAPEIANRMEPPREDEFSRNLLADDGSSQLSASEAL
jgi:hypothetical protein